MNEATTREVKRSRVLGAAARIAQALLCAFGVAVWLGFEFGVILPWVPGGMPSAEFKWGLPPWDEGAWLTLAALGLSVSAFLAGLQMILGETLRRRGVAVVDPGIEAGIHDSMRTPRRGMASIGRDKAPAQCAWTLGVTPLAVAAWIALPASVALATGFGSGSLWAVTGAQIGIVGGRAVALGVVVAFLGSVHLLRWAMPLLASRVTFFALATLLLLPSFMSMLRVPLAGDESSMTISAVGLLREGTLLPTEAVRLEAFERIGTNGSHVDVFDPDGPAGPMMPVPLHAPGMSVMIAPVAGLAYLTNAGAWPIRLVCLGIALLILGGMRSLARVLGAPRWAAGSVVLLIGATSVLPLNLLSLYPEPWAAAATLWAVWAMAPVLMARHHDKPEMAVLSSRRLALLLGATLLLPWLHLKFFPVSIVLLGCVIWTTSPLPMRRRWSLRGGAVGGLLAWAGLHAWLFGGQFFSWPWMWNFSFLGAGLVNSETGLVPFFPWIVLAIPAVGAVPRLARWRVAAVLGAIVVAYALAVTQSLNWNEGGGPPVRFLLLLAVLGGALLPVLVSRRPAYWVVLIPAVLLCALVSVRVMVDPITAMSVALQTTRTVLDLAFNAASWREMWPSVVLLGRGQPSETEGAGVAIAVAALLFIGVLLCVRRGWLAVGGAAMLVCAVPVAARLGDSPEWGRSALALFSRSTKEPAWSRFSESTRDESKEVWLAEIEYNRLVHLKATMRPVNTTFPRSVVRTSSIFFGFRRAKDELLSIGPMELHAGRYLLTVRGIADTTRARQAKRDVAAAGLELSWRPGEDDGGNALVAPQLALGEVQDRPANASDNSEVLVTLPITIMAPSEVGTITLRRRGALDARVDDLILVHTDSAFTVYEETESE